MEYITNLPYSLQVLLALTLSIAAGCGTYILMGIALKDIDSGQEEE